MISIEGKIQYEYIKQSKQISVTEKMDLGKRRLSHSDLSSHECDLR